MALPTTVVLQVWTPDWQCNIIWGLVINSLNRPTASENEGRVQPSWIPTGWFGCEFKHGSHESGDGRDGDWSCGQFVWFWTNGFSGAATCHPIKWSTNHRLKTDETPNPTCFGLQDCSLISIQLFEMSIQMHTEWWKNKSLVWEYWMKGRLIYAFRDGKGHGVQD